MRTFGRPHPNQAYIERPSVYAVIRDERGRIAAVEGRGGLFLPGGGIEPGETQLAALIREIKEELGRGVDPGEALDEAAEYVSDDSRELHVIKVSVFFEATLTDPSESPPRRPQHQWRWVSAADFIREAAHQSHAWIVAELAGRSSD